MMRRASFAAWSLAACAAGFSMSAGDVGAERRSLEARFGKKKPADPTKTMDWLKSKGLVGEAASGRAVGAVVDESGAVAEVVEKEALERFASSLESRVSDEEAVVDDMSAEFPLASGGGRWTSSCDAVMGGLSYVTAHGREVIDGREAMVLRGRVTTANNGGFVSAGLDVGPADASAFAGIRVVARSRDGEAYGLHLRTPDCARVFSSYRAAFAPAGGSWTTVDIPWSAFVGNGPGAAETPLDPASLRKISLLGIGRDFDADLAVADVRFYR